MSLVESDLGPDIFGSSGGRILPTGTWAEIRVPASSANLGPGFDCLGIALDFNDRIYVETTDAGLVVEVSGEGADEVPADASHLVVKAIESGLRDGGVGATGLRVRCTNSIPHSRGMGSSASAAVGGLVAASELMRTAFGRGAGGHPGLSQDRLVQLSSQFEGHPDNAAASVIGGAVIAWTEHTDGEGGDGPSGFAPESTGGPVQYRARRLNVHPDIRATVLVPEVTSSTALTRGLLPDVISHNDAAFNASRAAVLTYALEHDPHLLITATEDRLHQQYRAQALPVTTEWMHRLRQSGHAAVVSGAGPTILVLGVMPLPSDMREAAESEGLRVMELTIADGAGATASGVSTAFGVPH